MRFALLANALATNIVLPAFPCILFEMMKST